MSRSARMCSRSGTPRTRLDERAPDLDVGGKREHQQRQRRPQQRASPAAPSSPATSSTTSAGGEQAAPQVVEDLPARDDRQRVAARRRPLASGTVRPEPARDLPVAAHPAVQPRRERQVVDGVVVDQLDVGAQAGARVEPFEQVVAEQRVLRHAAARAPPRRHRRRRCPCRRSCPRGRDPGRRPTPRSCTGSMPTCPEKTWANGVRLALSTLDLHARLQHAVAFGHAPAARHRSAAGSADARACRPAGARLPSAAGCRSRA